MDPRPSPSDKTNGAKSEPEANLVMLSFRSSRGAVKAVTLVSTIGLDDLRQLHAIEVCGSARRFVSRWRRRRVFPVSAELMKAPKAVSSAFWSNLEWQWMTFLCIQDRVWMTMLWKNEVKYGGCPAVIFRFFNTRNLGHGNRE
jgi:hypothetical protein